jgi:pyruvate,water dikinase
MSEFILSLSDAQAALETVGGKGMSLARLVRAGLPVPAGFHVTTEAYRQFVAANNLQPAILDALKGVDASLPASLEAASSRISNHFAGGHIPEALAEEVRRAYLALCGDQPRKPVAVRSSATAEDLPGASFAGQQETYLNIQGPDAVLDAVQKCWASLWTARAIAYRLAQGIAPETVALAVVVQELVFADAAGIMFTANPVNGVRDEIMVTATWGLGEAIVSGSVTPDTLTLDKATARLLRRETAEKQLMTVRTEAGTREEPVPASRRRKPVLSNAQARTLARLGAEIDQLYDMPMDIEWTLARGRFAIVQARPITALPEPVAAGQPLEWPLPHPKAVLARGSFAEFVPEPVSPLFATLAVPIVRKTSGQMMKNFKMGDDVSYIVTVINDYVYIGFVFTFGMVLQMLGATLSMTKLLVTSSRQRGEAARLASQAVIDKWKARPAGSLTPSELLEAARELITATAEFYNVAQSGPIPSSMISEVFFGKYYDLLVKRKGDPDAVRFVFGTENHALRTEKALYDLAMWACTQPELKEYLLRAPAAEIAAALAAIRPSDTSLFDFSTRFSSYLNEHGHAIYDLDFAKPLPAEMPCTMLETLKVYIEGRNNPYERQQAALDLRSQAEPRIARRLDPLRRKYFLKLLHWAQDLSPLREDAIADLGLAYPLLRRLFFELGSRLAASGAIASAQDIYWLESDELGSLIPQVERGEPLRSHAADVDCRKRRWESMRSVVAPITLPHINWMKGLYPDTESSSRTIKGFAASAGRVTARACVMLGPEDFDRMQAGDVIVAGITTPAWTPLFARAAAIVTDIGGPLSHSSIVAREYGIPAVLATGVATRRIKDGQMITVDGTAGTVVPALS